jgi:hypothetical protein
MPSADNGFRTFLPVDEYRALRLEQDDVTCTCITWTKFYIASRVVVEIILSVVKAYV